MITKRSNDESTSHQLSIVDREVHLTRSFDPDDDDPSLGFITINKHKNTKLASIEMYDGFKSYGLCTHWQKQVLRGCNLKANNGEIYAILGPHACGKTTILHLFLGLSQLNHGQIEIFGFNPRNPSSGIPGIRIGYTPQREGLYLEFTIEEIFRYYASILKLSNEYLTQRINFLNELLLLPKVNLILKLHDDNVRRRVSFAIAILHEPQLLILDEPTYGVSPAIKKSIWKHLIYLSNEEDKTIIITTQNSMEAGYAHRVGILREGKIIVEGRPESIVTNHNEKSMETFYTKIYTQYRESLDKVVEKVMKQDITMPQNLRSSSSQGFDITSTSLRDFPHRIGGAIRSNTITVFNQLLTLRCKTCCPNINIILLISWKNCIMIKRNIGWSIYFLLVSLSLLILFFFCIGKWPNELPVGVHNGELEQSNECSTNFYSCQIMYKINSNIIKLITFNDNNSLMKAAKNGFLWGYIIFPKNFTQLIQSELLSDVFGTEKKSSKDLTFITISLDATNIINALEIEHAIRRAEFDFFNQIDMDDDSTSLAADYPLKFLPPMFGTDNSTYSEYVGSALALCWPVLMAFTIVVGFYMIERERNLHQMAYLIGIKRLDSIFGFILSFGTILILYTILTYLVLVYICYLPVIGSIFYFIVVVTGQIIFTSTFGITIAKLCKSWIVAASSLIYITLLFAAISGIVWPISTLPKWLKILSECLPLTAAIEAGRNILQRGFPLTHINVLSGIYIPFVYTVINTIFILVIIKLIPDF